MSVGLEVKKSTTLPDFSIRIMMSVLSDAGLDPRPALEAAGLPEGLSNQPAEISSGQEFRFQEAFVATTGYRPDLWFETGLRYHVPSFGPLGMALMTSMTLNELSLTMLKGRAIDYSLSKVHVISGEDNTRGRLIQIDGVPERLREFTAYRDVGATLAVLRDVWAGELPVTHIEMAVPKPGRGIFSYGGNEVVFGAKETIVTWDRADNHIKLRYGDPVLHAVYLEDVRLRAALPGAEGDLIDILISFLMRQDGTTPTLAMLAGETGQSERTLQRRLMEQGLKFRDIADEARRRMAMELVTCPRLPIAEIAWRLGYSETTSFNHAFKRWTGFSPAVYRRGGIVRSQYPT